MLSDEDFIEMMQVLPQWPPDELIDLIYGPNQRRTQKDLIAMDLLQGLLQVEPTKRLDAKQALDHELFSDIDKESIIKNMN